MRFHGVLNHSRAWLTLGFTSLGAFLPSHAGFYCPQAASGKGLVGSVTHGGMVEVGATTSEAHPPLWIPPERAVPSLNNASSFASGAAQAPFQPLPCPSEGNALL